MVGETSLFDVRGRSLPSPGTRIAAFLDAGPADETHLRIDAYDATMQPIDASKRALLHELTVSVFWPHRDLDLDFFIGLGKGYVAIDEIGRAMGSAMYFTMGDDFAMFGMMVTAPRLQTFGAGSWLLRQIMRDCAGRDLRLSATRSGYRLYETAGFTPVATIWQRQGITRRIHLPEPLPGLTLRPMDPGDAQALRDLDRIAYGADRGYVIDALSAPSEVLVAERAGVPCGFAMARRFGKGTVIGPVVAEDDRMAMRLVAPIVQRHEGQFLRIDTPVEAAEFQDFLAAAGMGAHDTVTEMRIGPHRRATTGPQVYGLAAQSLG